MVGDAPRSVLQQLQNAGYQEVRDIEFDGGLWEVDVRQGGLWREIAIHPDTGEIYDARSGRRVLARPEIMRSLQKQGYLSVRDIERKGAIWKAEVSDANRNCFDVAISGYDGSVLHREIDEDC